MHQGHIWPGNHQAAELEQQKQQLWCHCLITATSAEYVPHDAWPAGRSWTHGVQQQSGESSWPWGCWRRHWQ